MRICQIFISKTVGQQQQNDRVGIVAITFSPWSGHERMFFSLVKIDNDWHLTLIYYPIQPDGDFQVH